MLPASLSARWLSQEFVESTAAGGAFTLVAYVAMLCIFVVELSSFLGEAPLSELALDRPINGANPGLQINFDIDLYSIECRNLQIAVIDPLDNLPVKALSRDYTLRSVDFVKDPDVGTDRGIHRHVTESEEDEELERGRHRLEELDGKQELDADWASSHDGFHHQHFDHVIKYHDFTVVNFFAGWCSHCRQFSPQWAEIAQAINEKEFKDAGGHKRVVKALKMNCVDFQSLCRQQGINAFPTIRIYRSDGRFANLMEHRTRPSIMGWVERSVKEAEESTSFAKRHQELQTGCKAVGHLLVPRVPGFLELFAGGGDHALDPTMTNVSHFVRHLSFSDPGNSGTSFFNPWSAENNLPRNQRKHLHPLDGQKFCTKAFHQTYEHHLKVVSTVTSYGQTYQISPYHHIATSANKSEVPQARFNFDIDTFAIKIVEQERQYYQFVTSTMAILGGTFVLVKLVSTRAHSTA